MALDKLVDSTQLDSDLTSVANAIRTKGGTSAELAFPSGFVSAIQNIPTGGGGSTDGDVIFLDYDGTVVDAKTKTEINAMTSDSDLPANPTHTGLTAQGWNWTVAQLKTQLTAMPDQKVYVGQMYVTQSGKTEIDVEMQEGRLSPIMTIAVNGTVSVDWGDNTTPDTVTGTSLTGRKAVGPHNYANAGNYTITISVTSGSFAFYCGSSSYALLRKNATQNENKVYANCVKKIRIGTGMSNIGSYAFFSCTSLESIAIPSGVTSIGSNAFEYCYSLASVTIPSDVTSIGTSVFSYCSALTSVTIPSGVTSIGSSAFNACYALTSVTIPSGVTSIGSNAFNACYPLTSVTIPSGATSIGSYVFSYCSALTNVTIQSGETSIGSYVFSYCYALTSVTIPSGVTSIGNSAFLACYALESVTIPSDVTSIGNNAFQYCYGVKEYHLLPTTVPTAGTTIFSSIVSDCVIYVPRSENQTVLNAYKTASNWSTYASYMQEEPAS